MVDCLVIAICYLQLGKKWCLQNFCSKNKSKAWTPEIPESLQL